MPPPDDGNQPGPSPTSAERLIGQIVSDRYRIVELIATGGMGSVYRGEHVHMLKDVAIKVLSPEAERLPELVERFRREAIAGAHIRHPNIASATDFGQLADGTYFLVLEYVRGTTLDLVIEKGPVSVERAVRIARQVASALAAAHEMGIVHRDLKSRNVMLVDGQDDLVKVIDFGLARVDMDQVSSLSAPAQAPALTVVGELFGTVAYMAPESVLGMNAVDARSDLYALGVILYELLSGRRPFEADEPQEVFRQKRTLSPPPIPGAPAPLEAIVMRLLEKDPDKRFQTAADLGAALGSASPARASRVGDVRQIVRTWLERLGSRRRQIAISAGAGLVAIGVVAAIVSASRGKGESPSGGAAAPSGEAPSASAPREVALEVDGLDAPGWKMALRNAARAKEWQKGTIAITTLLRLDPKAFREHDTRAAMRTVVVGVEQEGGEAAQKIWSVLTSDSGSDGLDLVFDVARFRPGTKAAKTAVEILRRPEVMARATPALSVLFEFFDASCAAKRELFQRMVDQGDDRALLELTMLRDSECPRRKDPCCFTDNRALLSAIRTLSARLQVRQ
jgi:serine/threonine-protein kinase